MKTYQNILKTLLTIVFVTFITSFKLNQIKSNENDSDPWIEKILSEMTVEDKAGQVVFAFARGGYMSYDNPEYLGLKELVEKYKVGGLIFFQSEIMEEVYITNQLQRLSKIPLLISADFERGVAQRVSDATHFPYNMAVGAADDTILTYRMGRVIAEEGLAMGVQQNYAPVIDINNNPFNPIINVRSYGENRELVSRQGVAFMRGIQDGGMISTVKHFPGHGNTSVDSHNELAMINGSKEQLYNNELYPYINAINNGVMSVMVGHLSLPAFDKELALPATLSKNIITGLLKDELNFKGLIVTDAMNMHAITNSYSDADAAVKSINAGADCILYPDNPVECILGIRKAIISGEIKQERIDDAIRKILFVKKYSGLDKNKIVNTDDVMKVVGSKKNWRVASDIARASITLVKNNENVIPLQRNPKIKYAHLIITDNPRGEGGDYFQKILKEKITLNDGVIKINTKSNSNDLKEAYSVAAKSDLILLSVYQKVRAFQGSLGLEVLQKDFLKKLSKLKKPIILLSHGSPYIISNVPDVKAYLCNYGDPEVSEKALCEAIFGEIDIKGMLPVSIPETEFKYKSGIELNKSAIQEDYRYNSNDFTSVDSLVESSIKDTAFPGAVLLIAKDGKIIHHRAYGFYTYDPCSAAIKLNTVFDLASVSKVIATTTATMICVDKGLINIDDNVVKYLPDFGSEGKEKITIKNLLTHTSGLPAFKRFYLTCKNEKEVVKEIFNSKLDYPVGTKTIYSDLGMITLGKIIEKVSGKTLDKFCADEIFNPLGMLNTTYNPSKENKKIIAPTEIDTYWRKRLLIGEVHDEAASMLNGVAGHAGLFSNSIDLSILLQMLLQKGYYQGKVLIKKEIVEMFIKQVSENSSRALGWDTNKEGNASCGKLFEPHSYGHTGYTGTSVWTDPSKKLVVVFLTNRVHPTRENTKIIKIRPKLHELIIKSLN